MMGRSILYFLAFWQGEKRGVGKRHLRLGQELGHDLRYVSKADRRATRAVDGLTRRSRPAMCGWHRELHAPGTQPSPAWHVPQGLWSVTARPATRVSQWGQ